MANTVIIGSQWGDEGKGKIVDILAQDSSCIVRYQGGNNAGHTVEFEGQKYVLHLLPSGILRPDKVGVIGNNVVIDPSELVKEMDGLEASGIEITPDRLKISHTAHVTFDYHKILDGAQGGKVGTTKRGIGPTYADKVDRVGFSIGDLCEMSNDDLRAAVRENLEEKNHRLKGYGVSPLKLDEVMAPIIKARDRLRPYVCEDIMGVINSHDGSVLFEGAQGTFLDLDLGGYPFVTSSNSTIGGVRTGTGCGNISLDRIIGILKAYTTRVGEGPFPTEFIPYDELKASFPDDAKLKEMGLTPREWEVQQYSREDVIAAAVSGDPEALSRYFGHVGNEFGATTGRPRRSGWLDLPMAKYARDVNGYTEFAITKLDVLNHLDTIKVCVGYEIGGKSVDHFPIRRMGECVPIYEELEGWKQSLDHVRNAEDLPGNALKYMAFIQRHLHTPLGSVGTGAGRKQIVDLL